MRQLQLRFVAVYRDLESKSIPQKWFPPEITDLKGKVERLHAICYLWNFVGAYLISKFLVVRLIRGPNLLQTKGKESY